MAETVAKPKAHIDALTGIRFLAALVVYLSHHPQPAYLPDWVVTFFKAGYYGVTKYLSMEICKIYARAYGIQTPDTNSATVRQLK